MISELSLVAVPAAVFLLAATISPGPNNIIIAASTVSHGYLRTLPYIMGVILGFPLLVAFIGVGVHELFEAAPGLKRGFEIVALCMLLWMSYKVATDRSNPEEGTSARNPPGMVFAFFFQWVNPKAWTVAVSLITLYSDPSKGFFSADMLVLLLVAVFASVVSAHAWVGFGSVMAGYLREPRRMRAFNMTMGILLMLSAVVIFTA